MVEPDVLPLVVPLVMPVVEPEVVPDVELPLVVPDVEVPLVVPEVVPLVLPEVVPDVVLPEVEPDVLPLVVPAFSEAVQALKRTSDEHSSAPVSPVSHLRFIFIRKGKRVKEVLQPVAERLYERKNCYLPGFMPD